MFFTVQMSEVVHIAEHQDQARCGVEERLQPEKEGRLQHNHGNEELPVSNDLPHQLTWCKPFAGTREVGRAAMRSTVAGLISHAPLLKLPCDAELTFSGHH